MLWTIFVWVSVRSCELFLFRFLGWLACTIGLAGCSVGSLLLIFQLWNCAGQLAASAVNPITYSAGRHKVHRGPGRCLGPATATARHDRQRRRTRRIAHAGRLGNSATRWAHWPSLRRRNRRLSFRCFRRRRSSPLRGPAVVGGRNSIVVEVRHLVRVRRYLTSDDFPQQNTCWSDSNPRCLPSRAVRMKQGLP